MKGQGFEQTNGAAGYEFFSNFGTKIFVAGGGGGEGIIIDNKTKKSLTSKL